MTDEQTSGVHYDSTGVHNGSQVNNDDYSGQGRLAQTFDGTGDYIAVADHDDLTFANAGVDSAFSVSAWIRGDTGSAMIVDKYTSSDGWEFYIDGGRLTFDLNTATGWIGERTTAVVSGAWQHVAATYDGSKATTGIKLYIDGVLQATTTIGDAVYDGMSNSTTEVEIGAYDGGGNSWDFNGQIDEVRLGSTERSADWINA
ncbi:MAG: LamG domain-containing protein, partial [Planctomycetota bacterium]